MEMDIYERDSYVITLSNLAMLKIFHDAGVELNKINVSDFTENMHYPTNTCSDILLGGSQELFEQVIILEYEGLEKYKGELSDGIAENALVIGDKRLSKIVDSKYRDELERYIDANSKFEYSEVDINVVDSTSELIIQYWFTSMLHEIATIILKIVDKLNELIFRLEEEEINGVSDNTNRQVA